MLWQSSLLIGLMLGVEWMLRKRVRAAVRYALWLVVLAKLLLPPSLAVPTGIGWWLHLAATPNVEPRILPTTLTDGGAARGSNLTVAAEEPGKASQSASVSAAAGALLGSLAVSVSLLAWMTARWRQAVRRARRSCAPPLWLEELLETTRQTAGWRRPVRLCLIEGSLSPAVCGLVRPVLLFPQALVGQLSPQQLRAVFLHEMAHLRRGDLWVNCAQALLQVVYWWHPFLWLANARVRRVREEAVDDIVMTALREQADTYAPTLLQVARLALQRPHVSLGLVGILESHSFLRERIERLLEFRPPRQVGLTLSTGLCMIAVAAVALPMGAGPARSKVVSAELADAPQQQEVPSQPSTTLQRASAAANASAQGPTANQPQLTIQSKFVEIPAAATPIIWQKLGFRAGETNLATTLTAAEVATLLKDIESVPNADLMNLNSVTTLSDRQAMIQVGTFMTIVTNINPQALTPPGVTTTTNGSSELYLTTVLQVGPSVYLEPHVESDGWKVHLKSVSEVKEFSGYEPSTNSIPVYVNGKRTTASTPRPRIHVRQITHTALLWDGHTLVLGGPVAEKITIFKSKVPVLGDLPLVGRLFRNESTFTEKKHLLVFITPTLIDAAGNRLHTDEEVLGVCQREGGLRPASPALHSAGPSTGVR
jgi:beta-lactamase regulating signal transducer with metallopeptidase domain